MTDDPLKAIVAGAKAAKIAKLRAMIEICDHGGTTRAFVGAGGRIQLAPTTNRASYGGATGTCTWSNDAGLIDAWRGAALRLIAKLEETAA